MNLIALALVMSAPPKVTEIVEPLAKTVIVQAFVPAPERMSDRESAAWEVLADAMHDGTTEFSRDRLREFAGQASEPLVIEAWPDFMKVQVTEPTGGLQVGTLILESLCLRASLTDEAVQESVLRLRRRHLGPWSEAVFDLDLPYTKVTPDLVRNVYKNAFVPRALGFVVGGSFEAGAGSTEVLKRFDVQSAPPPRRTRFDREARQRLSHSAAVTTIEWRGGPTKSGDAKFVSRALALVALGTGKESALFRVARQQLGLTYRQEALFWPTTKGWEPRLVVARTSDKDPSELIGLLELLTKDVDGWDSSTLTRARAMLRSSLDGWNPLCPFWTRMGGPLQNSLEDRCAMAGIEQMSSQPGLALDLETPSLDDVKRASKELLSSASVSLIPGS